MADPPRETVTDLAPEVEEGFGLAGEVVRAVREALDRGDIERVEELVLPLHYADTADLFERLSGSDRMLVLDIIRPHLEADMLAELDEAVPLDLTVDGADEVDPGLDLIKGLGGALLREKMVAQASRRLVIMVDDSKEVRRLGTRAPLPVEVTRFGWRSQLAFLRQIGGEPALRSGEGGSPFLTDNGNHVIDCRFAGGLDDP